jgi:glycosyltransferase involved in cell wall biosynthesis
MMVSVIIPAYNAAGILGECLESLRQQQVSGINYEILVVDDGSTDQTRDMVLTHSGCRLITQANKGPAAARNLGANLAQGDILLFTDADCQPQPDWLARMIEPFQNPEIIGVKGAYLCRQPQLVARFVQLEYEEKYQRMRRYPFIDFIDTYSAAFRRPQFLAERGFDESFPHASVEDQEFSFRMARAGHKMVFVPEAQVFHRHADTFMKYFRKKWKIGFWKMKILRQLPEKIYHDSHTPQLLKIQIPLLFLGLAALLLTPFSWLPAQLLLGAFSLTTLPLVSRCLAKDPGVALIAVGMICGRALALGGGMLHGFIADWALRPSKKQ